MREDTETCLILRPTHECRLREIDARRPRRLPEKRWRAEDVFRLVLERSVVGHVVGEQVAHAAGDVEASRAAQQIVRGITGLETPKVHVVAAAANARIVEWRLDHLDLNPLHAVSGRRQDARQSKETRRVKRALALQLVVPYVRPPRSQEQHIENRLGGDLLVAEYDNVANGRRPIRKDAHRHRRTAGRVVHAQRGIHDGIRVAAVPHQALKADTHRIQRQEIQRLSDFEDRELIALFDGDERRVVVDAKRGDDRRFPLVNVERHRDTLATRCNGRVDRCLAVARPPVVDAHAQHVEPQVVVVEVMLLDENRRLAEETERL